MLKDITEISIEDLLKLETLGKWTFSKTLSFTKSMQLLTDFGASLVLNLAKNYQRGEDLDFISTDVLFISY